ncbi:MAG: YraN family protein, partial [Myxococcales bacterium]|nr:YraN family protein [Myxococcales bacterium]
AKRARLVRGARAWLDETGTAAARIRFDVIAVRMGHAGCVELNHLEGAFDAGEG